MATDTQHRPNAQHGKHPQHGRLHDAREAASDAARRAADGIESNPLGILVGGLAVGALAGALLPRSQREKDLLAPLGQQIGTRARSAFDSARQAGLDELDQRGLSKDGIRDQARGLLDGFGKALSSAGAAAAHSAQSNAASPSSNTNQVG